MDKRCLSSGWAAPDGGRPQLPNRKFIFVTLQKMRPTCSVD